ncbi:MAG: 4'-phosphopantetheinyl transferase family protein [Thermodesulfovibrionales bacterium]
MPSSRQSNDPALLLEGNTVHVWHIPLGLPAPLLKELYSTLSPREQQRSDSLRSETLKQRFIASHGLLRKVLGGYLRTDPALLVFTPGRSGKPSLAGSASGFHFNISHSGDLALYAVSHGPAVGIDLEKIRPVPNLTPLTKRFFTPGEHAAINALPSDEREKAFFRAWVLKEAYVKATGEGLAGLHSLEVSCSGSYGVPAPLIIKDRPGKASPAWSALSFEPSPGYVAALVVEGEHFVAVHCREGHDI